MNNIERDEAIGRQWPGFKVVCLKCGSQDVELENTISYSAISGLYGDVAFRCAGCGQWTSLT